MTDWEFYSDWRLAVAMLIVIAIAALVHGLVGWTSQNRTCSPPCRKGNEPP